MQSPPCGASPADEWMPVEFPPDGASLAAGISRRGTSYKTKINLSPNTFVGWNYFGKNLLTAISSLMHELFIFNGGGAKVVMQKNPVLVYPAVIDLSRDIPAEVINEVKETSPFHQHDNIFIFTTGGGGEEIPSEKFVLLRFSLNSERARDSFLWTTIESNELPEKFISWFAERVNNLFCKKFDVSRDSPLKTKLRIKSSKTRHGPSHEHASLEPQCDKSGSQLAMYLIRSVCSPGENALNDDPVSVASFLLDLIFSLTTNCYTNVPEPLQYYFKFLSECQNPSVFFMEFVGSNKNLLLYRDEENKFQRILSDDGETPRIGEFIAFGRNDRLYHEVLGAGAQVPITTVRSPPVQKRSQREELRPDKRTKADIAAMRQHFRDHYNAGGSSVDDTNFFNSDVIVDNNKDNDEISSITHPSSEGSGSNPNNASAATGTTTSNAPAVSTDPSVTAPATTASADTSSKASSAGTTTFNFNAPASTDTSTSPNAICGDDNADLSQQSQIAGNHFRLAQTLSSPFSSQWNDTNGAQIQEVYGDDNVYSSQQSHTGGNHFLFGQTFPSQPDDTNGAQIQEVFGDDNVYSSQQSHTGDNHFLPSQPGDTNGAQNQGGTRTQGVEEARRYPGYVWSLSSEQPNAHYSVQFGGKGGRKFLIQKRLQFPMKLANAPPGPRNANDDDDQPKEVVTLTKMDEFGHEVVTEVKVYSIPNNTLVGDASTWGHCRIFKFGDQYIIAPAFLCPSLILLLYTLFDPPKLADVRCPCKEECSQSIKTIDKRWLDAEGKHDCYEYTVHFSQRLCWRAQFAYVIDWGMYRLFVNTFAFYGPRLTLSFGSDELPPIPLSSRTKLSDWFSAPTNKELHNDNRKIDTTQCLVWYAGFVQKCVSNRPDDPAHKDLPQSLYLPFLKDGWYRHDFIQQNLGRVWRRRDDEGLPQTKEQWATAVVKSGVLKQKLETSINTTYHGDDAFTDVPNAGNAGNGLVELRTVK